MKRHRQSSILTGLVLVVVFLFAKGPVWGEDSQKGAQPATVSDTVALQREADSLEKAFTNALGNLNREKAHQSSSGSGLVWFIAGGVLLGVVVLVRYIPGLLEFRDASYQAQLAAARAAVQVHPEMAAEERAFSDFAARFTCGPAKKAKSPGDGAREVKSLAVEESQQLSKAVPVQTNKEKGTAPSAAGSNGSSGVLPAAKQLARLRTAVQELTAATSSLSKHNLLARAAQETQALKLAVGKPDMLPAWKVGSALEALLNQLANKPESVNPSTLRTMASAVDLIGVLCERGVRPNLAEDPPIRVLAVDDDPISRHAISFTLKKALTLPDLASDGTAGLELATQNAYDAIFLDIQMPGLNGFELCVKIRQTQLNRNTPIVFITCHSDFSLRSRASVAGGQDLIGKPFLTFEVALKALTLVLQHRLENDPVAETESAEPEVHVEAAAVT